LLVLPGYDRAFLQGCPIETMEGLDARAACRLRGMGIGTLGALATLDDRQATSLLGRGGAVLARLARGADTRSAARAAVPARLARMARITKEGDGCQEARERILDVAAELSRTLAGLGWTAARMDIDLDSHDGLLARASDELQFPVTEAGARQVAERLWPALSRHAMTASDFTVRLRGVKSAEAARSLPASARVPAQRCVFGT
jgi:DNA polymerase-4